MIDMHTHLLPGIDDGSESAAESIEMLRLEANDGIRMVVASPHFYADREDPVMFLDRRDRAEETLQNAIIEAASADVNPLIIEDMPRVRIGAEVHYFAGMGRCAEMEDLLIRGTRLLLLEMPRFAWTETVLDELIELRARNIRPVIAHVNRYEAFFNNSLIDSMDMNGVLFQVNTEAFFGIWTRKRAFKLLREGKLHLLGSDAHGSEYRPPNMEKTIELIREKCGNALVRRFEERADRIFENRR